MLFESVERGLKLMELEKCIQYTSLIISLKFYEVNIRNKEFNEINSASIHDSSEF